MKERKPANREQVEYEKNKSELKFKPKINKKAYITTGPPKEGAIYGMDKLIKRLQKGREEAEFKKKMTERSNFTVTGSIKHAKTQVKKGWVSKVGDGGTLATCIAPSNKF